VICGHINFLPLAFLHRLWSRTPVVLIIHGIEAWAPPRKPFARFLARRVDRFIAVSERTKERFLGWTHLPPERGLVLPNCVDPSRFGSGPKDSALLQRYGLRDKTVIMTLGRLASEERYKGFDEVLEVLPDLAKQVPNLAYLIVGDGTDRIRLVQKARSLGLPVADLAAAPGDSSSLPVEASSPLSPLPSPAVIFAGRIPDSQKADHFRLADAYIMPSQGEGFGIVFLEAMACGVPVIASKVDGSREAVRNGELGELVDPGKPEEIKAAILRVLSNRNGSQLRNPPPGLAYFYYANFEQRVHQFLQSFAVLN
jgi:glycosyltransferase involved in cell wall biosynthesis